MIRVSEFYPTIQGEGLYTGTPVVLLRLQGCTVGCPWCDTKYSWPQHRQVEVMGKSEDMRSDWPEEDLATTIASLVPDPARRWVLLTGGEPAEQDFRALAQALRRLGLRIMLETSGTAMFDRTHVDHVCVSPKLGMPGGKPVLREVVQLADEVKWVVGKQEDLDRLELFLDLHHLRMPEVHVSLQPLSANLHATRLCVAACLKRGYNLSVQVHKTVGLP